MTEESDNYEMMQQIRYDFVSAATEAIMWRIHLAMDVGIREIPIKDFGFSTLLPHGYEHSVQAKVVEKFEKAGYRCIVTFLDGGNSYLTIKGW